jgi:hypothetical protein
MKGGKILDKLNNFQLLRNDCKLRRLAQVIELVLCKWEVSIVHFGPDVDCSDSCCLIFLGWFRQMPGESPNLDFGYFLDNALTD